MIAIVWRYQAAPGAEARFRNAYGPQGAWARLFRQAEGYRHTELLQGEHGDFATLDYWDAAASFEGFMTRFGEAYARLDAECEDLTEHEERIGVFAVAL